MPPPITITAPLGFACSIITTFPYIMIQFDTVQGTELASNDSTTKTASILYPQLMGLSMGLPETALGLENNMVDIKGVLEFLS